MEQYSITMLLMFVSLFFQAQAIQGEMELYKLYTISSSYLVKMAMYKYVL